MKNFIIFFLVILILLLFYSIIKKKKNIEKFGIYGGDKILLNYCGEKEIKKKFTMIHGIPETMLDRDESRKSTSDNTWCLDYLANKENLDYCYKFNKNLTTKNILGYQIIYIDYVKKEPKYNNGLLVFYNHTWDGSNFGTNTLMKHKKYIKELKMLESKFSPIHVILYYKDYQNKELTDLLDKNNFHYLTNGKPNNERFMNNLINNIQDYKYCTSSLVGSHVWCCLYLDRYFFFYGNGEPCSSQISQWNLTCKDLRKMQVKNYPILEYDYFLKNKNNKNYKKQLKELGDNKVGLKYKKTKEEIKNIMV
jgi:hypothetical protein